MTRIARTLAVVTVIAAAGIVLTPPPAQAYSGSLDVSFGEHGMVTTDFGADDDGAASSAIQPDGKIVTGGHSGTDLGISSVYSDFALARYNFDGSLDGSFGTGGKVTTGFGGDEEAFSVAVQSDGKIALGGYASRGYFYDFAPICYHGHVSARQPDALIRERGGGTYVGDDDYDSSGNGQMESLGLSPGGKGGFSVKIQNDGRLASRFWIKGCANSRGFAVSYLNAGQSITTRVEAGAYATESLPPGSWAKIRLRIFVKPSVSIGATKECLLSATPEGDISTSDVVRADLSVTPDTLEVGVPDPALPSAG